MDLSFLLVLENTSLRSKIFSFLDTPNLGKVRFVCSKWAETGDSLLSKRRNRYFVLDSSIWDNRKCVKEFNSVKLKWMENCLNLNEESKFHLLQSVEIPIREVLECKEVREFLMKQGHLIKSLRLVKYEAFYVDRSFKISEDCSSPLQLLHLILTSWCRNLTSLSIIENLRNWTKDDEEEATFSQFIPQKPIFKEKLKLERLSIDLEVINKFLSNNIPISYFKEIFRSCPNLKHVRAVWTNGNIHKTGQLFFPEDKDSGLFNLETLELPFMCGECCFLTRITPENFPKLKNLNIGIMEPSLDKENDEGLLNHPGIKSITFRTNMGHNIYTLGIFLKLAPHASALQFVEGLRNNNQINHEIACHIYPGPYANIKKFELDARSRMVNIVDAVKVLGAECPNLELFKIKRVAEGLEDEEVKIRAIEQEIIDSMRNLRQFELVYFGQNWNDEDWEELRAFLAKKRDDERGRGVRFYFGSEDYLKTRTRFD